jgi:hypothetical protein
MLGHELQNRVEDGCPGGDLLSGVFYARDGVTAVTGCGMLLLQLRQIHRSTYWHVECKQDSQS